MKILRKIAASVDWDHYKQFNSVLNEYMPDRGDGDSISSQVVTAVNKLVFKWYNDGDVFDNTHDLKGWANDLSDYANWLFKYGPARCRSILRGIGGCVSEDDYEELLSDLADVCLDESYLAEHADDPKQGSIYDCSGPFKFVEEGYDEEDEYEEEEDEDDEYPGIERGYRW